MSRMIDAPVAVMATIGAVPQRFHWREKWHQVLCVLDEWRDVGCWWDSEPEKTFFRLQTVDGSVYELYHPVGQGSWHLYRVLD